jgi:hypothetical protein
MSNPDRLQREAQEHAETLLEDRGEVNARAWIKHCATRSRDGFWSRVLQAFEGLIEDRDNENDDDPAADYDDWKFHQEHDQ